MVTSRVEESVWIRGYQGVSTNGRINPSLISAKARKEEKEFVLHKKRNQSVTVACNDYRKIILLLRGELRTPFTEKTGTMWLNATAAIRRRRSSAGMNVWIKLLATGFLLAVLADSANGFLSCSPSPCKNGGTCVNKPNGGSYCK